MYKVDNRILGFSVTAAPDRINVGDRDYGEGVWTESHQFNLAEMMLRSIHQTVCYLFIIHAERSPVVGTS